MSDTDPKSKTAEGTPAAPSRKKITLTEAIQTLKGVTLDLTSLEVITFTGDVEDVLATDGTAIDWTKVRPSKGSTLTLVAATLIQFDGDSSHFQTSKPVERLDDLLKAHALAVQSGVETRRGILQFFGDTIKGLVLPSKAGTVAKPKDPPGGGGGSPQ